MIRAVLSHRLRAHRKLIHHAMHMHGQLAAVYLVGNVLELLKY